MKNSFCNGCVIHNRLLPTTHRFKYQMSWCLFDLDQINETFKQSRLWSINKFNFVSLYNHDYFNSDSASIKTKAVNFLQDKISREFSGKIYLFTHPRYLGFGFNSVNFYFCYENDELTYILSEINNTPWKQKHIYFHDIRNDNINNSATHYEFKFQKQFHISPFVEMEIDYLWKFEINDEKLNVSMQLKQDQKLLMNVALTTKLSPVETKNILKWTFKKPFQALKMFTGIYWQAFKLWAKKIPFISHPETKEIKP
jgi:DUF1365 family protein